MGRIWRTMKRLVICIFVLMASVVNAQTDLIGKTEAEMIAQKGKPVSKTVVGTKAIYRWEDAEVGFINGKVTSVTPRDPVREAELRKGSQKASQEAAKRRAQKEAQEKKNRAINEKYRTDNLAKEAEAAAQQQREKEEKDYLEQQAKFQEDQRRQAENQKTERLQIRPKTSQTR